MMLLTKDDWEKPTSIHNLDGMEPEKEAKMRNAASKFITEFGNVVLKLPLDTLFKALVIFHRYSWQVYHYKILKIISQ